MTRIHTPLEIDVRERELVYVSRAKLDQLLLPTEVTGGGLSIGGFGGNTETHSLGYREQLTRAGSFFQNQGLLTYGATPQAGSWLLTRALMVCGSAWPWAGDLSPSQSTAWWVGSSADARVIAYGHRDHLLGQGKPSHPSIDEAKATWWPSRADASVEILKEVAAYVTDDRLTDSDPWGSDQRFAAQVDGLESYFFSNSGVERGDPLVSRGVFEMMLRVDRTVVRDGRLTVAGSPLWVARERRAVDGVYAVTSNAEGDERIEGDWDGESWRSFRVMVQSPERALGPRREPTVKYHSPSSLSFQPDQPNVQDIISLGAPDWPRPGHVVPVDVAVERADVAARQGWGWLRPWRRH